MTTTYDPKHPRYLDEADVRGELVRVSEVCHGCQRCVALCTSFPSLFELIDRFDDHDAGRLTPAEQDRVVDECFQCKLCAVNCPYTPDLHAWAIDFPRLMLRVEAMRVDTGQKSIRNRATTKAMAHTDLIGALATSVAPLANRVVGAREGSFVRKVVSSFTGVSAVRVLPPFAKQRFSTWFEKHQPAVADRSQGPSRQGTVTVYPTCVVEYQETRIGKDLVRVYERNGIDCSLSGAGCCGAPWLHSGDLDRFTKVARKIVKTLAAEVRGGGGDIVVPQPTCAYVLKHDYADYVGGPDAQLVAEHTYDAAEYLMKIHNDVRTALDTDFAGPVPERITYHAACHLRAQDIGLTSRDLLELTGARITVVEQCSGIDGMWGLRKDNERISIPIARTLAERIDQAGGDLVAGDCNFANTAITEQTDRPAAHPLSVIARAYGIPNE